MGSSRSAPSWRASPGTPRNGPEYHDRIQQLAVSTGVPLLFGIVPAKPASDDQLALLETIAHAGGRATGMSHSRGISIILSFKSQLPFDTLPTWQTFRALPLDEQRTALADPDVRARLVEASRNEPTLSPPGPKRVGRTTAASSSSPAHSRRTPACTTSPSAAGSTRWRR